MSIKKNWNDETSYLPEELNVGKFKKCHLKCQHLIWMEDNTLYCKKKLKKVEKGFVCDEK